MIIFYYFRSIAVCPDCGTDLAKKEVKDEEGEKGNTFYCGTCMQSVKGLGNLRYRIEIKDFPRISSWWKYMGRHNVEHCPKCRKILKEGVCPKCEKQIEKPIFLMPKRQAKTQADWSTPGRTVGHMIRESFNKQHPSKKNPNPKNPHLYKLHYLREKAKYIKREPDWTDGHCHNSAWNNTTKLFLSHFWQVARTIDDKEMTLPYINQKNPAHNLILPYYYEGEIKKA